MQTNLKRYTASANAVGFVVCKCLAKYNLMDHHISRAIYIIDTSSIHFSKKNGDLYLFLTNFKQNWTQKKWDEIKNTASGF